MSQTCVFSFVLILFGLFNSTQVQCVCFNASVTIVLDDSESMRVYDATSDNFIFAADYSSFVSDLLNTFDPATVDVGLTTYSSSASIRVPLTNSYSSVISTIDGYALQFGEQNTNLGIDEARTELTNAGGSTAKYMIVFFDGTSFDTDATRDSVIAAGTDNITIIAVSMRGNLEESSIISGRSYRTFYVNSPSDLASSTDVIADISSIICNECKGFADVVYLLDGSDSTRRLSTDFQSTFYAPGVIGFVKNVTSKVPMGNIREGLIIYSETAQIIANMTGDANVIVNAMETASPEYLNTNAHLAFIKADEVFNSANPQRDTDTKKIVVYLVDGSVSDKPSLVTEATKVRDQGITVFAIGFASASLEIDLVLAAGQVSNTAKVDSDLDLETFVDPFVDFLCQTPPSLTQ